MIVTSTERTTLLQAISLRLPERPNIAGHVLVNDAIVTAEALAELSAGSVGEALRLLDEEMTHGGGGALPPVRGGPFSVISVERRTGYALIV